jgi:hypothetical protein
MLRAVDLGGLCWIGRDSGEAMVFPGAGPISAAREVI